MQTPPAPSPEKIEMQEEVPFLEWKYTYNEQTGKYESATVSLSDKSEITVESIKKTLKRTVGTSDCCIGERILQNIAYGMTHSKKEDRLNHTSALLSALCPKDETESMLLGQFLALQDSGMSCLRNANLPDQGFYHKEKLFLLANKLFATANQTMQTVLKYRSGGQQTVQVVYVRNEGQAIFSQNLSPGIRQEGI